MQNSLPHSSFARPAAPLLPLRHRHARLEADRLTKICLRECSWPPIRSGSGSGRRVRPPRAGYSTSAPCPLENLVPSYLYFLFDTVFRCPAWEPMLLSPRTLPPESKRRPRKIRNAQPGTCQGYRAPSDTSLGLILSFERTPAHPFFSLESLYGLTASPLRKVISPEGKRFRSRRGWWPLVTPSCDATLEVSP